jgi:hypothetical protein
MRDFTNVFESTSAITDSPSIGCGNFSAGQIGGTANKRVRLTVYTASGENTEALLEQVQFTQDYGC